MKSYKITIKDFLVDQKIIYVKANNKKEIMQNMEKIIYDAGNQPWEEPYFYKSVKPKIEEIK